MISEEAWIEALKNGGVHAQHSSEQWQTTTRDANGDGAVNSDTKSVAFKSTITCPHCGFKKEETMSTNACQFFYECNNCHQVLKPKQGDCCVFCSYGTTQCPPKQLGQSCC